MAHVGAAHAPRLAFSAGAGPGIAPWLVSAGNDKLPRWISCLALGLANPWFKEMRSAWFNALSKTIAQYSYGIYLTHIVAMTIAFETLAGHALSTQFAVLAILAVSLPFLAYHLIERPMISLGKKLASIASQQSILPWGEADDEPVLSQVPIRRAFADRD